jgi:SAM-dependent methyltransferase
MINRALMRVYPEVGAGGFSHVDGTVEFYTRVRALATPDSVIVDVGAGRGRFLEDPVTFRRELRMVKGDVARVIGVDLDPAVLENSSLDEGHVISTANTLPLDDESADIVVSDFTFEHVRDPQAFSDELQRILKPGGWICARTPAKWGYVGLGARLVPNRLHVRLLRRLQPDKAAEDTFPVAYRLNTRRSLRRYFPSERFADFSYTMNSEPAYFGSFAPAWRLVLLVERAVPARLNNTLYVFMRKHQ